MPDFRIAIAYETSTLGAAALEVCGRLQQQFNDSFRFHIATRSFCTLGGLPGTAAAAAAAAAAARASMIFVASAGGLPSALRHWLRGCIATADRRAPVALVDMTATGSVNAPAVHEFLESVAREHHLDLIRKERFGNAPRVVWHPEDQAAAANRANGNSRRQWGINE